MRGTETVRLDPAGLHTVTYNEFMTLYSRRINIEMGGADVKSVCSGASCLPAGVGGGLPDLTPAEAERLDVLQRAIGVRHVRQTGGQQLHGCVVILPLFFAM